MHNLKCFPSENKATAKRAVSFASKNASVIDESPALDGTNRGASIHCAVGRPLSFNANYAQPQLSPSLLCPHAIMLSLNYSTEMLLFKCSEVRTTLLLVSLKRTSTKTSRKRKAAAYGRIFREVNSKVALWNCVARSVQKLISALVVTERRTILNLDCKFQAPLELRMSTGST